jgi:hypothetical protein
MLTLTLDSASNNDTLIAHLPTLVPSFAGEASQIRCFNHVLNLVARTITRQFDVPRAKADAALAVAEQALLDLAAGIDIEEEEAQHIVIDDGEEGDEDVDDGDVADDSTGEADGWQDEQELLTEEELAEHNINVLPVRVVLVKVRQRHSRNVIDAHLDTDSQDSVRTD